MARRKQMKPLTHERRARAECFILCDYARAENGKLYIVGGGWDQIVPQRLPLEYEAYLAIKLVLEWKLRTDSFFAAVRAELLDKNGRLLGDPIFKTTLEGGPVEFEAGTIQLPEELEGGSVVIALFLAEEAKMALTEPGSFTLRLLVDDEVIATTDFRVTPPRESNREAT